VIAIPVRGPKDELKGMKARKKRCTTLLDVLNDRCEDIRMNSLLLAVG
jgi:hypothetical protein